jgi:putative membrane protein
MTLRDFAFLVMPWEPSIVLSALFLGAGVIYGRGAMRCRESAGRQGLFWTGFAMLYIASQTSLDYFAEHLFAVHRLQHVMLHHLGPVLIALSRPSAAFAAGTPWRWPRSVRKLTAALNGPVMAPLLFSILTLIWLIPSLHFAAMLNPLLYHVMNGSMALNGLMFWSAVVSGRSALWVRLVMAAAILPAQIAGGLVLVFARGDLYPVYALCGRATDVSALTDQQLGGAILWLSGGMMSLSVMAILAFQATERRAAAAA